MHSVILYKLTYPVCIFRIDFYDERSRLPSDEDAEVTVADIAIKILELNKPVLEFGHEPCEQVGILCEVLQLLYVL